MDDHERVYQDMDDDVLHDGIDDLVYGCRNWGLSSTS